MNLIFSDWILKTQATLQVFATEEIKEGEKQWNTRKNYLIYEMQKAVIGRINFDLNQNLI